MSTTAFYFLLPILLIFNPWGIGSLMSTIGKLRGWNTKKAFWISAASYVAILLLVWMKGDILIFFGLDDLAVVILFMIVIGLGFLSPFITLGLRWQYPNVFVKPSSSHTNLVKSIPAAQKQPLLVGIERKTKDILESVKASSSRKKKKAAPYEAVSRIFISYRRSDSADVSGRIYDRLVDRFGKNLIFKDVDSIPLGLDFKEYLGKKVGECEVLLAIIGDHWLDASDGIGARRLMDPSDFVRIEIESALERDIPVIPLLVRNATMPREDSLPSSLRNLVFRNGISIRSDPDFHRDMDRLIKALEKLVQ